MVHATNRRGMPFILMLVIVGLGFGSALASCASNQGSTHTTQASQPREPGPALWRIMDEDCVVYIFGVAELLPPDTDWKKPAIVKALDEADRFILEANESPEQQAKLAPTIQQLGLNQNGQTLQDSLTPEQKTVLSETMSKFGIPPQALAPLKPWLAAIQVAAINIQAQGYQNWSQGLPTLQTEMDARNKPVAYFEEDRIALLNIFSTMPDEVQVKTLMQSLQQINDEPDFSAKLATAWADGDVDMLTQFYHGEGRWADETLRQVLLVERNRAWIRQIVKLLKEEKGVVFIGVGAGHALGPDGLIKMAKQENLSVQRF